jgi:hypothetical protein
MIGRRSQNSFFCQRHSILSICSKKKGKIFSSALPAHFFQSKMSLSFSIWLVDKARPIRIVPFSQKLSPIGAVTNSRFTSPLLCCSFSLSLSSLSHVCHPTVSPPRARARVSQQQQMSPSFSFFSSSLLSFFLV